MTNLICNAYKYLNKILRLKKIESKYRNLLSSKRLFHKNLSSKSGRNSSHDTILIEDEHGTKIEFDDDAADCFNKYFCSIGKRFISSVELPIKKVNLSPENKPKSVFVSLLPIHKLSICYKILTLIK